MAAPVVLVTGASGYIGACVVKTLLEAGHKVRGTVRSLKDPAKVQPLYDLCPDAKHKLELVEADLTDENSWVEAVRGCTYVQHVASPFPSGTPKTEEEVIRPAVEGTLGVLRAATQVGGVKRIVLTSSCISISLCGGNKKPFTEKDWTDLSHKYATAYAKSKHLAEKAAWDYLKELPHGEKFELAVVNPAFVLGPPAAKSSGTSISTIQAIMMKAMPGLPHFYLNVCDVRDVATAHVECMNNPDAVGNRHIVYTGYIQLPAMGQILQKEFKSQGYDPLTKAVPNIATKILSWFNAETASRYVTLKDPMPFDNSRLRNVLKIEPIPIEKSLTDMVYKLVELGMLPKTPQYRGPSN
ncbi:hypothetical protein RRG08_019284 [Elysia crispata]|uniref:NAD-dependent epimerase/dehydratase domain-containing protein n=1 Tax=Elysia crispata TaxID=231223 RepID=A0AAE1D1Q7_9GAST|nr:hypothetical protein RRG08_019284 [Elysia crispata]